MRFPPKLFRRRLLVIYALVATVTITAVGLLQYSALKTQQQKINAQLVSRVTSVFNGKLRPQCDRFTSYNNNPQDFWQYYGYDEYNNNLAQNELTKLLVITSDQQTELHRLHSLLRESYLTEKSSLFRNFQDLYSRHFDESSQGIVFVSGKEYYWLTILSIKYIRHELKDPTPIEVFMPFYDKKDHFCNKMALVFPDVSCSYFNNYLPSRTVANMKGYQFKALALLLTKFSNVLYLDSDNIPIEAPATLFKSEKYLKHGMICWPDFWKRSTHPSFYEVSGLGPQSRVIASTPSVESGQMMVNKKTHLETLLLAYYYNLHGPDYFYPLFSQGFPGEGDKETFYLASRVTGEGSFLMTGIKTKIVGYIDSQNMFHGQSILQVDPDDVNKYAFFHCNYPKLQVDQLTRSYFYDTDTNTRRRSWQIMRDAKKDSNAGGLVMLKKGIKFDLELRVWVLIYELLTKDFKGFRLFETIGNDEMGDVVKEHIFFLKNQGTLIT
ncbi:hypothetical protein OGAPHI_006453 [Ogataea philodendri]|uniref:Alpha-1,2-mannosyltransferase n=2 Tax=Saccharomycotina TaxID=147537 RepID=A0A9P8NXJ1_9ASCO|nr:uncharacterized protein OGAPHI_006453 [Ogataea philodendri]KAH3661605.1 hypothetical protein OGAPHI_006453 [Ogataea philodendri]